MPNQGPPLHKQNLFLISFRWRNIRSRDALRPFATTKINDGSILNIDNQKEQPTASEKILEVSHEHFHLSKLIYTNYPK